MPNMPGVRPMMGNQQGMAGNIPNANVMNMQNMMNAQTGNANQQVPGNVVNQMNQMGGQMPMNNAQMNSINLMNMQQQQIGPNQMNPNLNQNINQGQMMMGRMNAQNINAAQGGPNAPQILNQMAGNAPGNLQPNMPGNLLPNQAIGGAGNAIPPNQIAAAGQMNLNQMLNPMQHMGRQQPGNVLYQGTSIILIRLLYYFCLSIIILLSKKQLEIRHRINHSFVRVQVHRLHRQ